jgi:FixJ family two-component response regulator
LLTDVILPGMRGPLLAKALAGSRPEMRVLYMSGYSEADPQARGNLPPDAHLLQKPFTKEALLREISEALSFAGVEALR